MKLLATLLLALALGAARFAAQAQVGIGTTTPHASAALDVQATNRAFYPPRLTSTQRQSIPNAQPGALVYDTNQATLYLYDGQSWRPLNLGDPGATASVPRTATDGATYDRFGAAVAIAGDYAVVGAPDKTVGPNSKRGGAYVYQRLNGTWTQQAILEPGGNSAPNQHFGSSVAIAGDWLIVGQALGGTAFLYLRTATGWQLGGSLGIGTNTPTTVAISANYAAVTDGGYTSKVYIYQRTGTSWAMQVVLTASDAKYGSGFSTVAMNDNDIICGDEYKAAIYGSDIFQESGEAHVFHRTGTVWAQQAILRNQGYVGTTAGPKDRDRMGASVAIEGDLVAVGADWRSANTTEGNGQGGVYLFRRTGTTWKQELILYSNEYPEPTEYGYFGASVALSNGYLLVGVPSRKVETTNAQGAAYLYKANSAGEWKRQAIYTDNSPANTYNGTSVGLSGTTTLIGGPGYQLNKGKVTFGTIQ